MTDIILNLVIFLLTVVLVVGFFRKDGQWVPERGKKAFRYFINGIILVLHLFLSAWTARDYLDYTFLCPEVDRFYNMRSRNF